MNRLRSFRFIEGMSQADLATLLSVSPQLISAIEAGARTQTLDLSPTGYDASRFDLPEMSEPLHRQRASTHVSASKRAKELLRLAGEVFNDLRPITPQTPKLRLQRIGPAASDDEIAELAEEIRCGVFGVEESGPIRNLTAAAERAGICLIPIVGLTGIDGLSSWVDGQPVIGLNVSVPGDRFRLTLAHEIGHLVMHQRKGENSEHEANRFAARVLMPDADFERAMESGPITLRSFVGLKSTWGSSVASMVYRARHDGFIDDQRYRSLQIQMSKWRKNEPGAFPPVTGQLLPQLVEQHGGSDGVAQRLGLNASHVREVVSWKPLRLT